MKISLFCKKVEAGGGVYFNSLYNTLKKLNLDVESILTPRYLGYVPPKVFFKNLKFNGDIIHTSEDVGFVVDKKSKPIVTTLFHCVLDPAYQKYTTNLQKIYHKFFVKKYVEKSLKNADSIIALSEHSKESIKKIFGYENVKVIYPGIDIEKFKPIKKDNNSGDKTKLLFVGNLIKRKGIDLLPKIMKELGDDFVLYHTSGLRTKKVFSEKNIISLGNLSVDNLIKAYNDCDIFLSPSRLESFGLSVAEAMACGKPVVTTNYSSLPELVIDGKGGFLCKMDDIKEFAEKIKYLAKDEYLMKRMGKFNRKKVLNDFSSEKMGKNYIKIYKSLI